jgi:hypothetical protein
MLKKSGLCAKFPEQVLDFLSQVVGEQTQWLPSDLPTCLDEIRTAAPVLMADNRYEQLRILLHMRGRG